MKIVATILFLFAALPALALPLIRGSEIINAIPDPYISSDGRVQHGAGEATLLEDGWTVPTEADYAAQAAQAAADAAAQAQAAQAAYLAKVTAIAGRAMLFRDAMEKHFGAGACTNTAITFAAVEQYFAQRYLTGTANPLDALDLSILQGTFPMITDITGDNTIWTFPWALIPEPGQ